MGISGMKRVRKLRIHWPIEREILARLAAGETQVFEEDPRMAAFLAALREMPELGDFGMYHHVFESGLGFEGFTVGEGANPTMGTVGERSVSPTFLLTTYIDADLSDDAVGRIVERVVAIHPWEVPVLEVSEALNISTFMTGRVAA
ncbi:hypothetical protein [Arthrobacter sp.]|uniref:hypothetical protein n=1 Tax=Arthrobacter sp. TaxID=1667 RepID=UPI00281174C2|nr:hypothetical protein [Arthrobacter sp.]